MNLRGILIVALFPALGCGSSSNSGSPQDNGQSGSGDVDGAGTLNAGGGGGTAGTSGGAGGNVSGRGAARIDRGAADTSGGAGGDATADSGVADRDSPETRDAGGDVARLVTLTGRVSYDFVPSTYDPATGVGGLQFSRSTEKPVRNGVVTVFEGMTVIGSTVTGADGTYRLSFSPSGKGALMLAALAQSVTPAIRVQDNTDGKLIWAIGRTITAASATENLHATHGWTGVSYNVQTRSAAPFAILDSMYTAATAFTALRPVQFPPLRVNWSSNNVPQPGDKTTGMISTSHFAPDDGEIYVLGKDGVDTDEFDAHVIVHEWGHYFERNLSRSDSPGGRHSLGDVLDPRIAFGEGWGNSIASMILPESIYADSSWSNRAMVSFGWDDENEPTPTNDPSPSAFSEASVGRLLYDLWDPANEPFDRVAVGLGPIYDILVGGQKSTDALTTLGSFITALKAQAGVDRGAIDTLLARYSIGPITSQWGDGDAPLRGMYTEADPLPFNGDIGLGGGNPSNSWQQNQYYVFTGTGGSVTVSASAVPDVAIRAYRKGVVVGEANGLAGGTETFTLATTASGARYVVVLTGYGAVAGNYNVSVSIE